MRGGGETEILAAAMKANFLYQGTGGATLAVNPADAKKTMNSVHPTQIRPSAGVHLCFFPCIFGFGNNQNN